MIRPLNAIVGFILSVTETTNAMSKGILPGL